MQSIHVKSNSPFEKTVGFSRAVRVGPFISVSGTAPITEDGTTAHPGDVYLQTKRCLQIIQTAIEQAGGKLVNVVRTRIYLKDITDWEHAANAHRAFFAEIAPACTMVEVKGFIDPKWLVELEADCVVEQWEQS